jgi:hypothetical protein
VSTVPEVETAGLLLRGWRDEDTDPWGELCADAEVMRPLGRAGGISLRGFSAAAGLRAPPP